jgi:uncharacterized membrane protein
MIVKGVAQEHRGPRSVLTSNRIEGLADGIFGFAMTLLVVNLIIPRGLPREQLASILSGQVSSFYAYALSFLLLGSFWVTHHHQFHYISRSDDMHAWINILMLLFVALMPFSTSLLANYSGTELSGVLFGGNLVMLGLFMSANWIYATSRRRLVRPDVEVEVIAAGVRRSFVTPTVAAIVIVVSLFYPGESSYIYLIIPPLLFTPCFRRK